VGCGAVYARTDLCFDDEEAKWSFFPDNALPMDFFLSPNCIQFLAPIQTVKSFMQAILFEFIVFQSDVKKTLLPLICVVQLRPFKFSISLFELFYPPTN